MRISKNFPKMAVSGIWAAYFFCAVPAFSNEPTKKTENADLPDRKARVEVTSTVTKEGKPSLTFQVKPATGMLLTFEAPWSLKFESQTGFQTDKSSFSKSDLDESLPGFSVPVKAEAGKSESSVQYKIVTFACTEDKKQCFREVHKKEFSFNNAAPN